MGVVFLFLDGVGVGEGNPEYNPLVAAPMPTLRTLLGGRVPTLEHPVLRTAEAVALPTDACLGVPGLPQSATGQATLLTGRNVPALLGEHYGPRPDARIRPLLENDTLFHTFMNAGLNVAFANAYPRTYFQKIEKGQRTPGAIAYAARAAGVRLRTGEDLVSGRAISVDFTNEGWRTLPGYEDIPLRTPEESGAIVAHLLEDHHLVFVEEWATDVVGHRQDHASATRLLNALDRFLRGLLACVDLERHIILITADHGNLEDLRSRRHTTNPAMTVLIGHLRVGHLHHLERLDGIRRWVESTVGMLAM